MLTPEYIRLITEASEALAAKLNRYITDAIIKRLMARFRRGEDFKLTATDKWQAESIQEAGGVLEDTMKEVQKISGESLKTVREAFRAAGTAALKWEDDVYRKAGIDAPEGLKQSPYVVRIMERNYRATAGEVRNLTRTTAGNSQTLFIQACDDALFKVQNGTSRTVAVREAVDQVAKHGAYITYPSGHRDTVETAVLRAVRTGIAQTAAEITLQRAKETGNDLVLVSAHLGARPEHETWQGKVYSISGTSTKYPSLTEVTGYGTGAGLCGWNCRHSMGVYVDGVSTNPYAGFDSEENRRLYVLTQEQREKERNIRKVKREAEGIKTAAENAQDDQDREELDQLHKSLKKKLAAMNKDYRAFCDNNGLKTQADRLYTARSGQISNSVADKPENRDMVVRVPGNNRIMENKTVEEKTKTAYNIVRDITDRESGWNGTVSTNSSLGANGVFRSDGSIEFKPGAGNRTVFHEILHSCSVPHILHERRAEVRKMEEASVEYLAREICRSKSIPFSYVANDRVDALMRINAILDIEDTDYSFARLVYSIDPNSRLRWLEGKIRRYLARNEGMKPELESLLKVLR